MSSPALPTRESGPAPTVRLPQLPALVIGEVRHSRRRPIRHDVRMRTHLWLVDLDDLPPSGSLASFEARDHFDEGDATIRDGLERLVRGEGEHVRPDDRLVMLAAPRTLGHVFNPLSVHWCLQPDGHVRFAVLEVHNTYGQRHAYLVHPDPHGRAVVDKQFYVSPFFEVRGRYHVRLILRPDRVAVSIVLHDEGPAFAASFTGRPAPASRGRRVKAAVRTPLAPQQTSARIRWHGVRLWRHLPVVPRPIAPTGQSTREAL